MYFERFKVFKTPSHRRFSYEPRYYNPKRDELEEKIKRHQAIQELDEKDEVSLRHRYAMQQRISESWQTSAKKQSHRSSLRLVIILGALVLIAYLLFLRIDILSAL